MSEKQEGDFITAYDTEKKTSTQAKISKIRRSFTSAFTRLWIAGSVLSVTPAHALQTEAGEWRAAGQLEKGTPLRSIKGIVRLDSTYTEAVTPTPVISYELEGGLDYVVGEMPVVVAGICQLRSVVEAFDGNKAAFQNLIRGLNPSQRSALIKGIAEINVIVGNSVDVSASLAKRKDFIKAFVADANFSQGIIADASLIKNVEWNTYNKYISGETGAKVLIIMKLCNNPRYEAYKKRSDKLIAEQLNDPKYAQYVDILQNQQIIMDEVYNYLESGKYLEEIA